MTMPGQNPQERDPGNYRAPDGFIKGYTFDAQGNVLADGKPLPGARIDVSTLKAPNPRQAIGNMGLASILNPLGVAKLENPYATQGGYISRLRTDEQGNVFAEIGGPGNKPQNTKGPGAVGLGNTEGSTNGLGSDPIPTVKLEGFALDSERTTRSGSGALPRNNLYLRQDGDGLYFAQVEKGIDTLAYSYNRYQTPGLALGSTQTDETQARAKKGGNLRGGAGIAPQTGTLLGG